MRERPYRKGRKGMQPDLPWGAEHVFFDAGGRLVDARIGARSPATLARRLDSLRNGAAHSPEGRRN